MASIGRASKLAKQMAKPCYLVLLIAYFGLGQFVRDSENVLNSEIYVAPNRKINLTIISLRICIVDHNFKYGRMILNL